MSLQPCRAQEAVDARADREILNADLEPAHPSCLVCRLRDATERMATMQWLAHLQQHRHEIPGVLFCPLHAWSAWEVVHPGAQPSTDVAGEWHQHLAALLAHALDVLVAQVVEVSSHVDDTGWRDALTSLLGKKRRMLLWECPPCPLCAATRQEHSDETVVLDTFGAYYAQLSSNDRQLVATRLCPRDRRLVQFFTPDIAEFLSKPHYPLTGYLPQWWMVEPEIGRADASFVRRLLESDQRIPDEACPACFVRAEHEQALLTEMHRKSERGEGALEMAALLEDLCSRHNALWRLDAESEDTQEWGSEAREGRGTQTIPIRCPGGLLRPVSRESGCMICTTLWGWDLLRMEGVRRAANGLLYDVGSIGDWGLVLQAHSYVFCLPHWRAVTGTASREVMRTLWPPRQQSLTRLLAVAQAHLKGLREKSPDARARVQRAPDQFDPCPAVLAALAGSPC